MTTSINERARACLKQQELPSSVQVWLYSKENTKKTYPLLYGEHFGCVEVVDTSKNCSAGLLEPTEDGQLKRSQIGWRTKKGNSASSRGQPVGVIDGLSMLLYSGSYYHKSFINVYAPPRYHYD